MRRRARAPLDRHSGPRVAPVGSPSDEVQRWLERSLSHDGQPLSIFRTIAHHPDLLKRYIAFGAVLLNDGLLEPRDRELVILRVAWNTQSEYEFGQHTRFALAAGVTGPEIDAVAAGPAMAARWSQADVLLIAAADELCTIDSLRSETFSRLAERFGDAELVELVMLVGYYRLTAGVLNALAVEREPGVPGWPRLLGGDAGHDGGTDE